MQYRKFFLTAILLISSMTFAQKSSFGNWLNYTGNQSFSKKWNWHNELQWRNYNIAGDTEQLLLRTGIGYNLTPNNNNILLGYAYIKSFNYIANSDLQNTVQEHRIFQQYIQRAQFGRLQVQHRYRLEERFMDNNFRFRFRYFLGLTLPLNKPTITEGSVYATATNEVFIHSDRPIYDRDRLYAGVGYGLTKDIRIEAGAMTQMLENRSRGQFMISIFNNIPFN